MQLRLPWAQTSARAIPREVTIEGRVFPLAVVRHHRARRYVLRVTDDGVLRLTVPRGASLGGGWRFVERQTDWIAREWRRRSTRAAPWLEGTTIWYRGAQVPLECIDGALHCGDQVIDLPNESPAQVQGAVGDLRTVVESRLRAVATRELPSRCLALAGDCGLQVARVSVRNQRSRWGACSPARVITLNWRLVQMPTAVSDYVLFHELMHLRQPNHSRKFWREVETVCPSWQESERWLRRYGRDLM